MNNRYRFPSERDGRRFRRVLGWGLLVSVALHAALLWGWQEGAPDGDAPRPAPPRDPVAAPGAADALQAVAVSDPRPEVPSPPVAEILPAPPERIPDERAVSEAAASVELARHGFSPPARGSGVEDGEAGGARGRARAPVPRSLLPEWNPPSGVRGLEVTVRVHVDEKGRPTGPVELRPPTPDEGFNRALIRKVREIEFAPARRAGEPAAAWAELTFSF